MANPQPYLIGVAGPSGSGKTELSRRLAALLWAPIISLDSYYRDLPHLTFEERARSNFDVPAALDAELLTEQLGTLARGGAIEVPVYDFTTHRRRAEVEPVAARDFIIVEGLFALSWDEVRRLMGTKVFVQTDDETCYRRRLERDVRERGRTPESVLEQYTRTVRPMAELYILPTRSFADVLVSGTAVLDASAAAVLEHVEGNLPHARGKLAAARALLAV